MESGDQDACRAADHETQQDVPPPVRPTCHEDSADTGTSDALIVPGDHQRDRLIVRDSERAPMGCRVAQDNAYVFARGQLTHVRPRFVIG